MPRVPLALLGAVLAVPTAAGAGSFLVIESDPSDAVAFGRRAVLTEPRSFFLPQRDLLFGTAQQSITVDLAGRYAARVNLGPPAGEPLVAGAYENARSLGDGDTPFLEVEEAGHCRDFRGRFVVHEVATDALGDLTTLSVDLEGACFGAPGGVRATLRYRRGDPGCAAAADGTPCDDENPCTLEDACRQGRCVGATSDECPSPGPCQVGVCNPLTAGCDVTDAAYGAPCDDGDPCTEGDGCAFGLCFGGTAKSCDDFDVCTTDQCAEGECLHAPVECPAPADPCRVPVCDPIFGCGSMPVAGCCRDDAECNDSNLCTRDACDPGTHRCTQDPLACWILRGRAVVTASALGRTVSRRSPLTGAMTVDENGRYRLPGFAGCSAETAVDEVGSLVPGRLGRLRLVPLNFDAERAAFAACSPSIRLRRRSGWVRTADVAPTLRGTIRLGGTSRVRGILVSVGLVARFTGERTLLVTEAR